VITTFFVPTVGLETVRVTFEHADCPRMKTMMTSMRIKETGFLDICCFMLQISYMILGG